MKWMDDLLHTIDNAQTEAELLDRIVSTARHLGFDYCAYGIRIPIPVTRPAVVMSNNFQPSWRQRYAQCEYIAVDPTVQHCTKSTIPIVWGEQITQQTPQMWEEARAAGLVHGWAQSCLDGRGSGGMLTLARPSDAITAQELASNQKYMRFLVNVAHQGFLRVLTPQWQLPQEKSLSRRECEVLKWAADGKTAYEIGLILSLSRETIKFHLRNAGSKLGVHNCTATVVRATTLGLLV